MRKFHDSVAHRARWAVALALTVAVAASAQGVPRGTTYRQVNPAYQTPRAVGRAPYGTQVHRGAVRATYADGTQMQRPPVSRAYQMQPQGEIRAGRTQARPVAYESEEMVGETIIQEEGQPIMPMPMDGGTTYPVEVIHGDPQYDSSYPVEEYTEDYSTCSTCNSGGGGICDYAPRSKGCDREKCPCPSDEALSYYRCNFYGHYPTLWRAWPEGFLKYRPDITQETVYDRYRPAPKGMDRGAGGKNDPDLDEQLKDLLRDQQKPGAESGTAPDGPRGAAPPARRTPDLLPEDALTPEPPAPGPKDGSHYQQRRIPARGNVRPVGYSR